MMKNSPEKLSAGPGLGSLAGIRVRCWMSALLLLVFQGVGALALHADPSPHFEDQIVLDSIRPYDLGISSLSPSVSTEITLNGNGEGLMPGFDAEMTNESSTVIRQIERLWEWKILKNKNEEKPYITTEYTIAGSDGKLDTFSSSNDPSSELAVSLEKGGVAIIEDKNNQWVATEGVRLLLDLAKITRSGQYSGTICALITISKY